MLGSASFASAGSNDNWQKTFVGGHEPMRQFSNEFVADKDAPYALTGRESARPIAQEIRVGGSRVVGMTAPTTPR